MRVGMQVVQSIQRMACTKCGAEANASCNCGVAYEALAGFKEKARQRDRAYKDRKRQQKQQTGDVAECGTDNSMDDSPTPPSYLGYDENDLTALANTAAREQEEPVSTEAFMNAVLMYADAAQQHVSKITEFMGKGFTLTDEAINEIELAAKAWASLSRSVR